jgi:ribosomal protein S4E
VGRIKDIKSGTMTRSQTALLEVDGSDWEVPSGYLMVVGKEAPLITLSV